MGAVLEFKQVRKTMGNSTLLPLIDLEVNAGQCVVIQCNYELGNRLHQAILAQTTISEGSIELQGMAVEHHTPDSIRNLVGVQLQADSVYGRLTVREYIRFFSQLYASRIDREILLQDVGLMDKQHVRIAKLTPSELRRLLIAKALVHEPQLLLLEDPEQNVDLETSFILRHLLQKLQREGRAVLVTTMVLEQAITMTNDVYLFSHSGFKKLDRLEEEPVEEVSPVITAMELESPDVEEYPASEQLSKMVEVVEKQAAQTMEDTAAQLHEPLQMYPFRIEKIPAKVSDKIILFDPTEIHYIESHEGISNLHVSQGIYPCSLTLSELEAKLKAFGYLRCHRSYLVNLQKVREVITWTRNSYSLILDDPKKSSIPLSKSKFDELKQIMGL